VEVAEAHALPDLVQLSQLRGDLHVHTRWSDGHADIRTMALAARRRGLRYIAITDHSGSLAIAQGLGPERLMAQGQEIDRLNAELTGITILKGCEVDILVDGNLDMPDAVLADLDVVIGAVHTHLELPEKAQTERILRALDHPRLHILAHPSGRLLLERAPHAASLGRIVRHAKARGCCLELNSQPKRLDLDDVLCKLAKEEGVIVSINSDSHHEDGFDDLALGIEQARRGWLGRHDVLNTRSLAQLRRWLARA
jgi:DNA polymerase (family 10)